MPADEISFLDDVIDEADLAEARLHALVLGTGADRALVRAGKIDDETFGRALAEATGCGFDRLLDRSWRDCPLPADRIFHGVRAGMIPLRGAAGPVWAVAPVGLAARRFVALCAAEPDLARRIVITPAADLQRFAARLTAPALAEEAASKLHRQWPHLSAAPRPGRRLRLALASGFALALAAAALIPSPVAAVLDVMLAFWFLAWMALRLAGIAAAPATKERIARTGSRDLPVYTVIVPLYREAAALRPLLASLRAFDWPADKLDIKLVIEPDDSEMRAALKRCPPGPDIQIVVAPKQGPRTKPKALNAALPFARGEFTVIFDAEDRPDRDQLRKAHDCFMRHDATLACVQARLTIDNTADGWLTRLFTAEYAGQFDAFLPGIARMRMALPLGGSSNHFRTQVLRKVAGWDAHNVTEDADLGLRLARFGYRSVVIDSSTYEEAPAEIGAWIRQRTRWSKGWMQTWLVHMRQPLGFLREAGLGGFLTLQCAVAGQVIGGLIHPFFVVEMLWFAAQVAAGSPAVAPDMLHLGVVAAGYATAVVSGLVGLRRRGLLRHAWALLLTPLYWLLLSAAAWRAVHQLALRPSQWEKTQHGLARSSRRADAYAAH